MDALSTLRGQLDELRQTVQDHRSNRSTVSEAQSLGARAIAQAQNLIQDARDAGRELRASESRNVDAFHDIVEEANELRNRANAQVRSLTPTPTFGTREDAGADPAYRAAFDRYLRTGEAGELRAMSVGTDTAGGYAVPQGFRNKITETLKAFGGIRRVAEVIETESGNDLPWPTNDDTANSGSIKTENAAAGETDLVLGQKALGAYMYSSDVVKWSVELSQDNGVDLESFVARKLGERIARDQSGHWVTGTGTSQPQGLVTGGTVGVTTTAVAAVTYDELVDTTDAVDPAYLEEEDNVVWVFNQSTLTALRKIKDSNGLPVLEPSAARGVPNTLLGYRYVIDQGMPSLGAGNKPIAFGNIRRGYIIRTVRGMGVVQFRERYMDALQHAALGFERADGLVQDSAAYTVTQNAAV